MPKIILIVMLFFNVSLQALDSDRTSIKPILLSALLLGNCAIANAQNLVLDEPLSDKWTYDNTNAQTICGIIGFLGLSMQFFSNWYFYNQGQKKILAEHLQHKKDLLERYSRGSKLAQALQDNETYQRLITQCNCKYLSTDRALVIPDREDDQPEN